MVPAGSVQSATRKEAVSLTPQVLFMGLFAVHAILPKQTLHLPWEGLLCLEMLAHEKASQLCLFEARLEKSEIQTLVRCEDSCLCKNAFGV